VALSPRLKASDTTLRKKFAALNTFADVADLLEVPLPELRYILYDGRGHYPYREFDIVKRGGGSRTIHAPHPTYRILQRKLDRVLRLVTRHHAAAHGFLSSRSIVTNAAGHVGKGVILNLDLEKFFPSINFGRVQGVLRSKPFGVGYAAATVMAQLCCLDHKLPQGAPTSPILSNMICFRLDSQLVALAREHRAYYSRYADDITFSSWSKNISPALATPTGAGAGATIGSALRRTIEDNDFKINENKVRVLPRGTSQRVTGITVSQKPNVNRTFVRTTRAMILNYSSKGNDWSQARLAALYASQHRVGSPPIESVIRGRLAYIRMVRGSSDPVYVKLCALANELVFEKKITPGLYTYYRAARLAACGSPDGSQR